MTEKTKQYAERDAMALDQAGNYYCRHVWAMTREGLDSKGDIAAELGHRDLQIDTLTGQVNMMAAVLKEARRVWLEEYDPRDGTDCVTPFDHLLYGHYQPSDVQEDDLRTQKFKEFVAFVRAAPVETGICCCGASMHDDGHDHTRVDQWENMLSSWVEDLKKLGVTV